MGTHTEKLKAIMRKERIKTYRKRGGRLEQKVKERKRREERTDEEEGVIYKVNSKDCNKDWRNKIWNGEGYRVWKGRLQCYSKTCKRRRT